MAQRLVLDGKQSDYTITYDEKTHKTFIYKNGKLVTSFDATNNVTSVQFNADNATLDLVYYTSKKGDVVSGNRAPKMLFTGAGNDTITAVAGDMIDGGSGNDTVNITGKYNDYTITKRSDGTLVLVARDGKSKPIILENVENVVFSDMTLICGNASNNKFVTDLRKSDLQKADLQKADSKPGNPEHYIIDGGAGNDTLTVKATYPDTDPKNPDSLFGSFLDLTCFTYSLDAQNHLVMTDVTTGISETLVNIENLVLTEYQTYESPVSETYTLYIGTPNNDSIAIKGSALVLTGDGDDKVTIGSGYLDLGDGNDTATITGAYETVIHGSFGNDTYKFTVGNNSILPLFDYSAIVSVDMKVTSSGGANKRYLTATIDKYGAQTHKATDTPIGQDTITAKGSSIDPWIRTGDGDDSISISGLHDGFSIFAGKGSNTINIDDSISQMDGIDRLIAAALSSVHVGAGNDTVKLTKGSAAEFIFDMATSSVYADLGQQKAWLKSNNGAQIATWSVSDGSYLAFKFDENNTADTVIGSNNADIVYLGLNDKASLGGGDDYVEDAGSYSVDGGAGYDTYQLDFPDDWFADKSPDAKKQTTKVTVDAANGKINWELDNSGAKIATRQTLISNFENYILYANPGNTVGDLVTDLTFFGTDKDETITVFPNNYGDVSQYAENITLTGGGGNDTFQFYVLDSQQTDQFTVTDFDQRMGEHDKIDLSNLTLYAAANAWMKILIGQTNTEVLMSDGTMGFITSNSGHIFDKSDFVVPTNVKVTFVTQGI